MKASEAPICELSRVPVVRLMPAAILQPRLRLVDGDHVITGNAFSLDAMREHDDYPREDIRPNPIMKGRILQAFDFSRRQNNRFNADGSPFGVYYAGTTLAVCIEEIRWHLANQPDPSFDRTRTYRTITARASGRYLDLRKARGPALDPDVAIGYPAGQAIAAAMHGRVDGIIYPSARHAEGTNIAIFEPERLTDFKLGQLLAFEREQKDWGYRPVVPAYLALQRMENGR